MVAKGAQVAGWASCQAGKPSSRAQRSASVADDLETGREAVGCQKRALSLIGLVSLKSSETVTVLTLAPREWRCRGEVPVNCDRSGGDETPTSRSDLQT